MAKVVSYVFDSLFERKESVSYKEKRAVVITFFALTVTTIVILALI